MPPSAKSNSTVIERASHELARVPRHVTGILFQRSLTDSLLGQSQMPGGVLGVPAGVGVERADGAARQIPNDEIPKQKIGTGRIACAALVALCVVEAGIWFLLVKTYSRGGLVAAGVAMGVFFGLRGLCGTGWKPVLLLKSTGKLPVPLLRSACPKSMCRRIISLGD